MNIDLTRVIGSAEISVAECIDKRYGTWRVRTDFQPFIDNVTGKEDGVTFIETEFPYKPSMNDVKDFVLGVINAKTDAKILSGFVWQGINVWLSEENQRNFSEAQRMAEKYGDAVLPLRFKLGEDSEGNPVYHTFETVAELDAFYTKAFRYVNQCLNEGWTIKDNFDWSPYEELLPNPDLPVTE